MNIALYQILFLILPMIVFMSVITDMRAYIIPNSFNLILFISFYGYAWVNPDFDLQMIGYHTLTGFGVLVITFGLFALGIFGGGDAKLIAAISLWLGMHDSIYFLLYTILAGGGVALLFLLWRKTKALRIYDRISLLHSLYYGPKDLDDIKTSKQAIPYAIAIAIGFFVIFPRHDLF